MKNLGVSMSWLGLLVPRCCAVAAAVCCFVLQAQELVIFRDGDDMIRFFYL